MTQSGHGAAVPGDRLVMWLVRLHAISDVGRGRIVASPKRLVEIRQIVEPKLEGDSADRALRIEWIDQDTIGPRETPTDHEFRIGDAFVLEQLGK
jgi:hypothetical protein